MWTWNSEACDSRQLRFWPEHEDRRLDFAEVLGLWRASDAFRTSFNDLLADAPFAAFRWETPPVTVESIRRPLEFVLIDSPDLAIAPDPSPFAEHFRRAGNQSVVRFSNLSGDAELVVPCPAGPKAAYGHLAAFVRRAPGAQVHALWREVALAMEGRVGRRPVWLSTAGGGVAWLHVRLDDRPKYYGYGPYRNERLDR